MEIRKASKSDFEAVAALYKAAFKVHNIFSLSIPKIVAYFNDISRKSAMLVAVEDDEVVGACVLFSKKQAPNHNLSRIKHLAVSPAMQSRGIGKQLVAEAEKIAGRGKMEIHAAESEADLIAFYRKLGYALEGNLKSHYRPGEACFILGKVLE